MIKILVVVYILLLPIIIALIKSCIIDNSYVNIYNPNLISQKRIYGNKAKISYGNSEAEITKIKGQWFYNINQSSSSVLRLNERYGLTRDLSFAVTDNPRNSLFPSNIYLCIAFILVVVPFIYMSYSGFVEYQISDYAAHESDLYDKRTINDKRTAKHEQMDEAAFIGIQDEDIADDNFITIVNIKGIEDEYQYETQSIKISSETVLISADNVMYSASDLVRKRLCLSYKGGEGNICIFLGQYDENYCWDGECKITSYKDGKLFFTTRDMYANGENTSYERFSIKNNKWIFTSKSKDDQGNMYGDTISYSYQDIFEKDYDIACPQEEALYDISEVSKLLDQNKLSHYHGSYDDEQDWDDDSGNAYVVKYDEGKIKEIFKGTFYNNHYGKGYLISPLSDDEFALSVGSFHDSDGNIVIGEVQYEIVSESVAKGYFGGELFEDEVISMLRN